MDVAQDVPDIGRIARHAALRGLGAGGSRLDLQRPFNHGDMLHRAMGVRFRAKGPAGFQQDFIPLGAARSLGRT